MDRKPLGRYVVTHGMDPCVRRRDRPTYPTGPDRRRVPIRHSRRSDFMTPRDRPSGRAWRTSTTIPVLSHIEERVALDGDTATRRFQKMMVVVVALVGSVATVFNAQQLFRVDLPSMGWAYVASAVWLAVGAGLILLWPRAFVVVTFLLLMDVLIFPTLVQVQSGGITSGLYAMPWTLFAPLGAALALGAGAAFIHLGLFVAAVTLVAFLEPHAPGWAPVITDEALVAFNVPSLVSLGVMAAATSLYLVRQVERFRIEADSLLHNVLPDAIATRLKSGEHPLADGYDGVTVLFADLADFTRQSSESEPDEIVTVLDDLFSEFDRLAALRGVEKIKTVGDAYMAAAGLPEPTTDHVPVILGLAQDMLTAVEGRSGIGGAPIHLRIGVHTGPAVAGVIGRERFIYDLWGDTVNLASRMQANGVIDRIQVTGEVVAAAGEGYSFETRHPIPIKGKGMMTTYLLAT